MIRHFEDGTIATVPGEPTELIYVSLVARVGDRTYNHTISYNSPLRSTETVLGNLMATAVAKVIDQSKGVST